jgi:uncharacterized protein with FMN-binding domain
MPQQIDSYPEASHRSRCVRVDNTNTEELAVKRLVSIAALVVAALVLSLPLVAQTAYADGKYLLDYKDAELGSVVVSVLVKSGRIAAVELPQGPGDVSLESDQLKAYLASIVSAPDLLKVDAISGATQSCDLIKYAVQNALKQSPQK